MFGLDTCIDSAYQNERACLCMCARVCMSLYVYQIMIKYRWNSHANCPNECEHFWYSYHWCQRGIGAMLPIIRCVDQKHATDHNESKWSRRLSLDFYVSRLSVSILRASLPRFPIIAPIVSSARLRHRLCVYLFPSSNNSQVKCAL